MRQLSIAAAARDAGGRVALRAGGRSYTFAELADLARERAAALAGRGPHPLAGTATLDTAVTLYALLELGIPALMLHPRLTAHEREALLARAAHAGPLPDGAAAVVFTSGTTGASRGAVLTRRALVASANASAANLGWNDDDCWLACMTLAHVGGLSIVTRALAARRAVALEERFDAAAFTEWIDAHRATLASLVPTMLARVLDANPRWTPPPHFRALLLGGAAAPAKLLELARARRVPVLTTYGLTETCSQVTTSRYAQRFSPDASAGEPLAGAEVRIVDGRIQVRGEMLMAGYWNEPPLAAGGWFETGDAGEIDAQGRLHVYGRRTDLIVTGGENVYPAEVEQALEAMAGIVAAGVFGVPDADWGEAVAVALVVDAPRPSAAQLSAHFAAKLAPHKRPRRVCFVDALPLTRGGKLDRRALRAFAPSLRPL